MLNISYPTVFILCGVPCSGKSTWAEAAKLFGAKIISRDQVRVDYYGLPYNKIPQNSNSEKIISALFDAKLSTAVAQKRDIVLDNTHCKKVYLDVAIERFKETNYKVYVVFFDIPLWKAYLRNIKRYLFTKKWIPTKVIKAMLNNYNKINKNEYDKFNFYNW